MIELSLLDIFLLISGSVVGIVSAYSIPTIISHPEKFQIFGLGILVQEAAFAKVIIGDWWLTLVFVAMVSLTTSIGFWLGKNKLEKN